MKLPSNVFRASVGAVIINESGKVLAFERTDIKEAWQLPQGGMKKNEEPLEAVYRELQEETGLSINEIQLIDEYPEWLAYEVPKEKRNGKYGRGQVQKWFLFRLISSENKINLAIHKKPEFVSWKWMTFSELVQISAPFRKNIYGKLKERFG